ncbi:fructokinase [Coralliovum pocilloporae]|uniref:fructokinase n=1 Tax=Coralliovum pocilloporae TaxID=3066369 RepID=UPI0033078986
MRIGIDLGGTKTEAILLDDDGRIVFRERLSTPKGDYQGTLETVVRLVSLAEASIGARLPDIGIGIPGTISPATSLVKNANSTWLNGQPLRQDLTDQLGREVHIANDANCLAVSEAVDGAAAGADCVLAIIIGTGCGSGIALKGRPLVGRHGIAGEIGHNPLPWMTEEDFPGPLCWCGQRGCIETFVSGTAFQKDYGSDGKETFFGTDIIRLMRAGDTHARAAYDRYVDRLARTLAHAINLLDPGVIVLGGGMSNVDELYTDLPALIPRHVFSDVCNTPVRKAMHGDSSGVRGAAWLCPR